MYKLLRTQYFRIGLLIALMVVLAWNAPMQAIARQVVPATTGTNAIGMVCTEDSSPSPIFNLQTATGYMQTPDGNQVFMWGYTLDP